MTNQELAERTAELKKKLAVFIWQCSYGHNAPTDEGKEWANKQADSILALLKSHGMVFLSEVQALPNAEYFGDYSAQKRMVADGFRRVLLP